MFINSILSSFRNVRNRRSTSGITMGFLAVSLLLLLAGCGGAGVMQDTPLNTLSDSSSTVHRAFPYEDDGIIRSSPSPSPSSSPRP